MATTELSESQTRSLKKQVLRDYESKLTEGMGNPERYFTKLRSAGLLDRYDCEKIRHEVTSRDKVGVMVGILDQGRQGRDGRSPFDVLMDVLIEEGVHLAVARGLQRALARAKEEELQVAAMGECHGLSVFS